MHPDLQMNVSIDATLKKLIGMVGPLVNDLETAQGDRDGFFRILLEAVFAEEELKIHKTILGGGWNLADILGTIFLLKRNYRLAWLCKIYLMDGWWQYIKKEPPNNSDPSTRPVLVDEPYFSDMRLMWHIYESNAYMSYSDQIGWYRSYRDPTNLGAFVSPVNEGRNELEVIRDKLVDKAQSGGPSPMLYDPGAEARYANCLGYRNFHLRYESLQEKLFEYIEGLLANDDDLAAAEHLFRIRIMISSRNPPKGDTCPKLIQVSSLTNCLECWLQARLAQNPRQRRTLGWMAVYWLMQNLRASPEKYPYYSLHAIFARLCGLIAEFDLFENGQAEFEKQMKLFISISGKTQARRMLEDPIAPSLADMGGISGVQAVALYRQIAAEHGKY